MAATQLYRAQHAELLALTEQIAVLIGTDNILASAVTVRSLISTLAGKLSIHLAMEDRRLYPNLMAHSDPNVRTLAHRYAEEMGSLADDFTQFNRRWLMAANIDEAQSEFVREANIIFAALRSRIEKEDQVLYKLVDEIDD